MNLNVLNQKNSIVKKFYHRKSRCFKITFNLQMVNCHFDDSSKDNWQESDSEECDDSEKNKYIYVYETSRNIPREHGTSILWCDCTGTKGLP